MDRNQTAAPDLPELPTDPLDVPFDQYQRYRLTADVAEAMLAHPAGGALRVLDVGGHHQDFWQRARRPIADFLPQCETVTVDVTPNPLRGYVRGRGDALPFRDGSFDLVCSVDVLEHVPAPARPTLFAEMTRVARRGVLLAAPFDHPEVERAERFLADFIRRTCGYEQGQLAEHRQMGLPDLPATCAAFGTLGWHVRVWPYGNLWRWLLMMLDKHALSALPGSRLPHAKLDRQYNERWFESDRTRPSYRHFICATSSADDPVLPLLEERFGATGSPVAGDEGDDRHAAIWDLIAVHAANQSRQIELEPDRRDGHVAELEAQRQVLHTHLDAVKRENARLTRLLRDVEQSRTYRAAAFVRRWLSGSR